jgi:hypothetical protein
MYEVLQKLLNLNTLGALASIIGLFITLLILNEAKNIRRSFVQKIRIPEAYKTLSEISSLLSKLISSWPEEKQEILKELARIRSILLNLKSKLDGDDKRQTVNLIRKLGYKRFFWRRQDLSKLNKNELWDIYSELIAIVESLKQTNKDIKWR